MGGTTGRLPQSEHTPWPFLRDSGPSCGCAPIFGPVAWAERAWGRRSSFGFFAATLDSILLVWVIHIVGMGVPGVVFTILNVQY